MLGGAAWLGVVLYFLPFHEQMWNRLQAALAAAFTMSALAAVVGMLSDQDSNTGGAAWALAFAPALFAGYALASMRFHQFGNSTELTSPGEEFIQAVRCY